MAFYSALFDAIQDYTGLSPAAFFTILALMIAVYHVVSGMFVAPDDHLNNHPRAVPEPFVPPEPVQLGDVTEEELRAYDGSDPKKPLLMAIKGQIYDVSMSRLFYGPGGPYALFAGRDASRALALMSFDANDLTGNTEGLGPSELETLQDWELKFMEKYAKVGQIVKEKTTSGDIVRSEKPECSEEPNKESENIVKDLGKLEENGEKTEGSMEWSKETENINKDSGKFEENGQKTECSEEPKKETENISKDSGIIDETAAGKI